MISTGSKVSDHQLECHLSANVCSDTHSDIGDVLELIGSPIAEASPYSVDTVGWPKTLEPPNSTSLWRASGYTQWTS